MTEHLYYHNSFLYEFDAEVVEVARLIHARRSFWIALRFIPPAADRCLIRAGSFLREKQADGYGLRKSPNETTEAFCISWKIQRRFKLAAVSTG